MVIGQEGTLKVAACLNPDEHSIICPVSFANQKVSDNLQIGSRLVVFKVKTTAHPWHGQSLLFHLGASLLHHRLPLTFTLAYRTCRKIRAQHLLAWHPES